VQSAGQHSGATVGGQLLPPDPATAANTLISGSLFAVEKQIFHAG